MISVERSSRNFERQYCGNAGNFTWFENYALEFNCVIIGDKISFYRSKGSKILGLCEVKVYGSEINSSEDCKLKYKLKYN